MQYLAIGIILFLFGCGNSASNPALIGNGGGIQTSDPSAVTTNSCQLSVVGAYQNNSDGIVATIQTRNGECGIHLSCGLDGYIYKTGSAANEYTWVVDQANGDSVGGCAVRAQSTNLNGHSGKYQVINFTNNVSNWLGAFIPSEEGMGHTWSKI